MASKLNEIRQLNDSEILQKIEILAKELFDLRYKARTSQIEKPHRISQIRKEVARYKTNLREKELADAGK